MLYYVFEALLAVCILYILILYTISPDTYVYIYLSYTFIVYQRVIFDHHFMVLYIKNKYLDNKEWA